jgi:predicted  nucleic acid-binding Zn-ribbon protein
LLNSDLNLCKNQIDDLSNQLRDSNNTILEKETEVITLNNTIVDLKNKHAINEQNLESVNYMLDVKSK